MPFEVTSAPKDETYTTDVLSKVQSYKAGNDFISTNTLCYLNNNCVACLGIEKMKKILSIPERVGKLQCRL